MALRIIYLLISIFVLVNVFIYALSNILGVDIYKKYSKELKIIFWIFIVAFFALLLLAIGVSIGAK